MVYLIDEEYLMVSRIRSPTPGAHQLAGGDR
jgi:hypothetical protein